MYHTEKRKIMPLSVQIIAHRGASAEAPENTIAAINRALALGADYVEIDVRLSKEGIPVLLHDPSTSRVAGNSCTLPIDSLYLDQIQEIEIGKPFGEAFFGERIPTLHDVLNLNWKKTGLMLEIKEGSQEPKQLVEAVFSVFDSIKCPLPSLVIGSFSLDIMKEVQKHPSYGKFSISRIGILEKMERVPLFLEEGIKHLALWHPLATLELTSFLKKEGIEMWAFTVDDLKIARHLISLSIKGIISNNPKKLLESEVYDLH